MRYVVTPDNPFAEHITETEYQLLREQYQQKAVDLLKETGADCIVYAVDHYNAAGVTTYNTFTLCPLTEKEFYQRIPESGALIHSIHSPTSEIGRWVMTWGTKSDNKRPLACAFFTDNENEPSGTIGRNVD